MKYTIIILILTVMGCESNQVNESKVNANIKVASRYFTEVYNEDRIDLIDTLFTKDYQHTNTEGRVLNGRAELKSAVERIESLLPNLHLDIEEAIADDEKVMFLVRMQSDLPSMASKTTKATATDFNETFIFWVKEDSIYKGRSVGAHLPFIKQVSGFEGGLTDLIMAVSPGMDTSANETVK